MRKTHRNRIVHSPAIWSRGGALDGYFEDEYNELERAEFGNVKVGHYGDKYSYTQINIYVNAKNRVPDAEELYQEILRKRKKGNYQ